MDVMTQPGNSDMVRFQRAPDLEDLDAHFLESVTLSQLSDIADLIRFHLLRLFRAFVGLPPHAYLIQRRIDRAQSLLSQRLPA